jgi:hypothetical protein
MGGPSENPQQPLSDRNDSIDESVGFSIADNFVDPESGQELTYSIVSGLPVGTGLSIDPDTGVISGTPTTADLAAEPMSVVVRATNTDGAFASITIEFGSDPVDPPDPPDPPSGDWPQYGKHAQGAANVSSYQNQLLNEPYSTWQANKDICFIQQIWPGEGYVENVYNGVLAGKAQNAGVKYLLYTNHWRGMEDGAVTLDQNSIRDEAHRVNGRPSSWLQYDNNDDQVKYEGTGQNPTPVTRYNPYQPAQGAGSQDANFEAAVDRQYEQLLGSGAAYNVLSVVDGWFEDSADFRDLFGAGGYDGNPNYLNNGQSSGNDPTYYRQAMVTSFAYRRANAWGTGAVACSNGGRDNTEVDRVPGDSDFDWEDHLDFRLSENVQAKFGLEKESDTVGLRVTAPNTTNTFNNTIRALLISELMVDTSASNRAGKGIVMMDWVATSLQNHNWQQSYDDPLSWGSEWHEAARFIAGVSMLHDSFMACPTVSRGQWPWPHYDEFVYDPGDPVGGPPSIGSIDTSDTDFELTLRTADDNGFYWQEYDNVLWVVNCNPPDSRSGGVNAPYPQEDTDTCTLPSAGTGFEWRHAEYDYVNSDRPATGFGARQGLGYSSDVNDGSLPDGTGSTLTIPRWTARMLVRTPT